MTEKYTQRGCVVPRPGKILCSVDYDGFELRAWAQVCIWAVGFSRMAEALNSGVDPHLKLGARIHDLSFEAASLLKGSERSKVRQSAKCANFGYPGGMGPKGFRKHVRKEFDIHLTLHEAESIHANWKEEWTEAQEYFDWVKKRIGRERDSRGTIKHFKSDFVRGNVGYTNACNSYFQNLATSAWKDAGFQLAKEMYVVKESPLFGSRTLLPLHDEYITEIPIERGHEAGMRQAEVMRSVAQSWMPDVKISCSPALMTRWQKGAETVFDTQGRLVPWEP